jgi:hypothetical protein
MPTAAFPIHFFTFHMRLCSCKADCARSPFPSPRHPVLNNHRHRIASQTQHAGPSGGLALFHVSPTITNPAFNIRSVIKT